MLVSALSTDMTGTIFAKQFQPLEGRLKDCGTLYTIIRVPLLLEFLYLQQESIKNQGTIFGPINEVTKFSPMTLQDVADAIAAVLANPTKHINKTYRLVTPPITHAELAQVFSAATGKPVHYQQVSYDVARTSLVNGGLAEWQADGILELYRHMEEDAPYNASQGDFRTITGRDPTSLDAWAQQVGGTFK